MPRTAERTGLTPGEYLAWEKNQERRHEYFAGEVFAMAGGSRRHNALCASAIAALHSAFERGAGACRVFSSDQKVGIAGDRYVYPDVTVVCGSPEPAGPDSELIENPAVVVEVVSSSTEQYDRGLKWEAYQRIATLTDYVLVSQNEPRIEHFTRGAGGDWTYRAAGAGGRVTLNNGAVLEVDRVFLGVFELIGD